MCDRDNPSLPAGGIAGSYSQKHPSPSPNGGDLAFRMIYSTFKFLRRISYSTVLECCKRGKRKSNRRSGPTSGPTSSLTQGYRPARLILRAPEYQSTVRRRSLRVCLSLPPFCRSENEGLVLCLLPSKDRPCSIFQYSIRTVDIFAGPKSSDGHHVFT